LKWSVLGSYIKKRWQVIELSPDFNPGIQKEARMDISNKKVLVTGADGFIGSHLAEGLLWEGCKVRAFVYYNSFNSWGWLDTFPKDTLRKIDIFTGDVRDPNGVRKAMEGIDIVFHLAALIGIPFSYHSPDSYVDTNIKGTLNILQSARDNKCGKVIITSTSEVYGTAEYTPIDEKHALKPQSPYSATKIAADCLADSFFRSFNLPVCIARPFNTFGPRQSARAVIPAIIIQLLSKENAIRLGSLPPQRDFLFVKDTVEAFIKIAQSDKVIGETLNIATCTTVSIGDLAAKLIKMINPKARIITDSVRIRPGKSEVERLIGSAEKLKRLAGWKPQYTFDKALRETVAWFKIDANLRKYKHEIYNI